MKSQLIFAFIIFICLMIWFVLGYIIYRIGINFLNYFKKNDIKVFGRTMDFYKIKKQQFLIYLLIIFILVPIILLLKLF